MNERKILENIKYLFGTDCLEKTTIINKLKKALGIEELEKKLDADIESRKNWEDAWVKVSNSYLKWNDKLTKLEEKYESLNKDFIKLVNLIKKIKELTSQEPEPFNSSIVESISSIVESMKNFGKMAENGMDKSISNLSKQQKYFGGEKELPKHENGLNHMHGINSETSVLDSKLPEPIGEVDRQANKIFSEYKEWEHNHKFKEQILKDFEKCSECGGYRMGEIMIHEDYCSQSTSTTTGEVTISKPKTEINDEKISNNSATEFSATDKDFELVGIKPNPEYLNQFIVSEPPIKDCTNCEFVYSSEPTPCSTCENHSNWSPSKRLDIVDIEKLGEKAVKIRKLYPNFNDYILKFMKAGEKVMSENGFTAQNGYEIMKEVIELCNPEKDVLTPKQYIYQLSNKALKFMNDCFDYIIYDYELNEGKKSILKKQYKKQMEHQ